MVRVNVVRPLVPPPSAVPHPESYQELFLLEEEGDVLASEGITEDAVQTRRRLEWLLAPPEHMVSSWYSNLPTPPSPASDCSFFKHPADLQLTFRSLCR